MPHEGARSGGISLLREEGRDMRISQWLATLAMIGLLFGFGSFGSNDDGISSGGNQSTLPNQSLQYHFDNMH